MEGSRDPHRGGPAPSPRRRQHRGARGARRSRGNRALRVTGPRAEARVPERGSDRRGSCRVSCTRATPRSSRAPSGAASSSDAHRSASSGCATSTAAGSRSTARSRAIAVDDDRLLLVTAREVTDRVRAEREFVANAAHELLTPLAAMQAALDVLQRRRQGGAGGSRRVPRRSRARGRTARPARTRAARARSGAGDGRIAPAAIRVELRPLLQDVAECLAPAPTCRSMSSATGRGAGRARSARARALEPRRERRRAHARRLDRADGRRRRATGRVGIEMRDTGCGMPPVGARGRSTASTARAPAATRASASGSRSCTRSCACSTAPSRSSPSPASAPRCGSCCPTAAAMSSRVLVVEDEPTIRRAVGYALRRDGFDVEESGDGGEALELAEALVRRRDPRPRTADRLRHRGAAAPACRRPRADHRADGARDRVRPHPRARARRRRLRHEAVLDGRADEPRARAPASLRARGLASRPGARRRRPQDRPRTPPGLGRRPLGLPHGLAVQAAGAARGAPGRRRHPARDHAPPVGVGLRRRRARLRRPHLEPASQDRARLVPSTAGRDDPRGGLQARVAAPRRRDRNPAKARLPQEIERNLAGAADLPAYCRPP